MLWYYGEALVEEELQAVVDGTDEEATPPQIWAPMANRLYELDELVLIGCGLQMMWRERPAKEGQGPHTLVQNGAKSCARGITFDHECNVECR